MNKVEIAIRRGVLLYLLLGMALIVMKAMHAIVWSWWLVTLPLWGIPTLLISLLCLIALAAALED